MPVRLLHSPVFKWPDRHQVETALVAWAETCARTHPTVRRIGYFGSYARGDWGVGSDLDVVMVVEDGALLPPFERRGAAWDLSALPVPTDVLVYTVSEWRAVVERGDRFARVLNQEVAWVHVREDEAAR